MASVSWKRRYSRQEARIVRRRTEKGAIQLAPMALPINYLLLHRFRFRQIHDPLADFTCDGWLEYDIIQSDTI